MGGAGRPRRQRVLRAPHPQTLTRVALVTITSIGYKAVIFDVGGVIFPSPFEAWAKYERELDLPVGFIRNVVASRGEEGAWARLERSEIAFEEFCRDFEAECDAAGGKLSAAEVLGRLGQGEVRAEMIEALRRIKAAGLKTAAITNNWVTEETSSDDAGRFASFRDQLFDAVVESAKVGMRKPDPRIYELACEELGVEPSEAVFLDDLGVNLKPARALGMATIKVVDPDDALKELEALLGFSVA